MSEPSPHNLDRLHIRILESVREDNFIHSNEIFLWVMRDYPSPAIFLRHLEDLTQWDYMKFEFDQGYRRTKLGTHAVKKIRETVQS